MILISRTFDVVTPESAEDGESAESGFITESEFVTFRELVSLMRAALEAVDRADTYVHERGAALAMVRAVLKGGAV